jgi:hypothetical protein
MSALGQKRTSTHKVIGSVECPMIGSVEYPTKAGAPMRDKMRYPYAIVGDADSKLLPNPSVKLEVRCWMLPRRRHDNVSNIPSPISLF